MGQQRTALQLVTFAHSVRGDLMIAAHSLTFFVAMYSSTRRCLTRPGGSAGKGVVWAVSNPTSSCQVVPVEKKSKGRNFSTTHFTARSSRTLKKGAKSKQNKQQRQRSCGRRHWGQRERPPAVHYHSARARLPRGGLLASTRSPAHFLSEAYLNHLDASGLFSRKRCTEIEQHPMRKAVMRLVYKKSLWITPHAETRFSNTQVQRNRCLGVRRSPNKVGDRRCTHGSYGASQHAENQ